MVKKCLSRMSGKLSRTVLRRGKGSNPFSLVDYTSRIFHSKLQAAGMKQSMSRVARCIDNGPMEGFWGILKRERYYGYKFTSREHLVQAISDYIFYYNNRRLQRRLYIMTPMEFHKQYVKAA